MNIEEIRNYCLSLPGAEEGFPFGEDTLVFKISGKMFAFIPLDATETYINLKCDPELAIDFREKYTAVQPGYHMNKKYWNTVYITESVSDRLLKEWIKHSYNEVVRKLPKAEQEKYL